VALTGSGVFAGEAGRLPAGADEATEMGRDGADGIAANLGGSRSAADGSAGCEGIAASSGVLVSVIFDLDVETVVTLFCGWEAAPPADPDDAVADSDGTGSVPGVTALSPFVAVAIPAVGGPDGDRRKRPNPPAATASNPMAPSRYRQPSRRDGGAGGAWS